MDWMIFAIGLGFVLTGAVFFGLPLGYALGKRAAHHEICGLPPTVVREATDRLWGRNILNAEYLEDK